MPDKITEIVDQSAFDQVAKLKSDMTQLATAFTDAFKQANAFNDALRAAKGLPEFKGGANGASQSLSELEKILKQLSVTRERLSLSENRYNQALAESKMALKDINAETNEQIKLSKAADGSINQLRIQLKSLQSQYDALGKSARESLGKDMLTNIQKLDTELKKLEGSTGRYQRNVGDYKNQLFGLTQVFRELPGFTYSAQTGILGLSNNLPILADNFKNVASATNEVTGKVNGTMGALKIFGASIFSFGNIFAIAIGLFTIFSKEIFDFIGLNKDAKDSVQDLNKAFDDGVRSVADETTRMNLLYSIATNVTLSYTNRKNAVNELQKLYPDYLGNLSDEAIMAGNAKDAYNELNKALLSKSIYQGFVSQANKIGETLSPLLVELDRVNEKIQELGGQRGGSINGYFVTGAQSANDKQFLDDLKVKAEELRSKIAPLQREMNNLYNVAGKYSNNLTTPAPKGGQTTVSETKITSPTMEALKLMRTNLDKFNSELSKNTMDDVKRNIDQMMDYAASHPIQIEWTWQDKFDVFIEELTKVTTNVSSVFNELGDIGNEAAGLIADQANARYEREIKNIDRVEKAQLDSLNRLSMSDKQREEERKKIELSAEQRRQKSERDKITALRKAAQVQKAADIANIISGTAMAIVNALKTPPAPLGIALAAGVGVTGGIQLARAISAPLPQYAKGRGKGKNELAIVGEAGHEAIIHGDGSVEITPNVPTPTFLKADDMVMTNTELMRQINNTAMVKLSTQGVVTPNKFETALIESFEAKLDNLTNAVNRIKMKAEFINMSDHISHVKSKVR